MNWLNRLLNSKISITIITHDTKDITYSKTPRLVEEKVFKRKKLSNFRFVEETETSHDGSQRTKYFTQVYEHGRWGFVSNSLSFSKEEAMRLHLKAIEAGTLDPKTSTTVLWEGLSKEETKTWVEVQL